jgi:hypothetical protein
MYFFLILNSCMKLFSPFFFFIKKIIYIYIYIYIYITVERSNPSTLQVCLFFIVICDDFSFRVSFATKDNDLAGQQKQPANNRDDGDKYFVCLWNYLFSLSLYLFVFLFCSLILF